MNFVILDDIDNEDMFITAPFDSTVPLHAGLNDFERSLRCDICQDFLNIPVSVVPCHHTFCSECIRNHIRECLRQVTRNVKCPSCREGMTGNEQRDLIPNRSIEALVRKYMVVRNDLRDALASQLTVNDVRDDEEEESNDQGGDEEEELKQEDGERNDEQLMRRTTRSTSASRSTSATEPAASNSTPPQEVQRRLQKKPSTHYNALKRKDLVTLCKAEGLSTAGTERELKQRHQEFVTLWNAQCDSHFPKSAAELARQVMKREQLRKKEAKGNQAHAVALEQLKRNRAAMGNDDAAVGTATSGNSKFDAEFNAKFAELAKSMPPRKKRKWVDPTPANDEGSMHNGRQESEAPTDQKPAALEAPPSVASAASVPGNTASDTPRPPSQTTARPNNPYVKPDTSAISASKTNADKVSPTSVSDAKISNTNSVPPASARKPTSLMDFLQVSTPAARRPSSSQPSASSSRSSSIGSWSCNACTFLNDNNRWSRATCEMCGTQRAAPQETIPLDV